MECYYWSVTPPHNFTFICVCNVLVISKIYLAAFILLQRRYAQLYWCFNIVSDKTTAPQNCLASVTDAHACIPES